MIADIGWLKATIVSIQGNTEESDDVVRMIQVSNAASKSKKENFFFTNNVNLTNKT